ncbi:toxin glutamine deamidase domain-containing protein [Kitasatospora sp. NPDC088134]|uniref:toxin glutamine deamidase domain-containing protein n=1 Tax=Kitasatospora sp. NPDC088134 TaxID=3364071 RepID=UPI00381112A7
MMLPDGLEWVLEMLGFDWPKADEDKLRECAQVWRDFADQVDEINYQALSAASSVRSANLGDDIDAFGKAFDKFTTGGDGYLADAAQAARLIAMAFDAAAMIVVACKIAVIAQLVILAAEIIAAQAAAPFTFGLSEVGALGATQATKMIVRRLLKELRDALIEAIMETLKDPIVSAVQGMISDLIAQTVNQGFGAQNGYDLGRTAKRGIEDGVDAAKNWQDTFTESLRDGVGSRAGGAVRHRADSAAGHGDGNGDGNGGSHENGNSGESGNSGTGNGSGENGSGNGSGNGSRTGGNEGSTPNGGDSSGGTRTAPSPSSTTPGSTNTPTPHPTSPTSQTGDTSTTTRPDSAPRPTPAPTPTADHRSTDQSDPFGTRLTPQSDTTPAPAPTHTTTPTTAAPTPDQATTQPHPDSRPAPHAQTDSTPASDAPPQGGAVPNHGGDPAGSDARPGAHPQGDAPSGQAPTSDPRPAPHAQADGAPASGPGTHPQGGGVPNSTPHGDGPAPHVRNDGAPTPTPGPDSRPQGDGPSGHAPTPGAHPAPHAQADGAPTPGPGAHPQGDGPSGHTPAPDSRPAPHAQADGVPTPGPGAHPQGDGPSGHTPAPDSRPAPHAQTDSTPAPDARPQGDGPSHHTPTPDSRPAPHAQTDGAPAPGPDSRPQGGGVPNPAPHPVGADPRGDGHNAAADGPRPEGESRGPGRPGDETSGVAPGGAARPAPGAPSGAEHTRPAAAPQHETPGAQPPPVPGVPHVPGPVADPSRQNAEHEAPRANVQTASTAVADAPPTRAPHPDVPPQGTPQPNPTAGPVATGPTGMPPVNPTAGPMSSAAPRSDRPTGSPPPAATHRPTADAPRPDRPVTLGQQPTTGRPDPRTAPWGRQPATPSHPDAPSRPNSVPHQQRSGAPSRSDATQRPNAAPAQPRSDAPSRPDGADRTPTSRPDSTQRPNAVPSQPRSDAPSRPDTTPHPNTVPVQPRSADHPPTAPNRDNPTHPDPRSTDPRATDPHGTDPHGSDPRHPDSRPADSTPTPSDSDSPTTHRSEDVPAHDPSQPATADRPYGEPGGLVEPTDRDRQRVEESVPRGADGRPLRHPDPGGDWPRAVNGDPNEPGRRNNCVDVALATVDTYSGHPTPAAARTPDHDADGNPSDRGERNGRDRIENALGAKFSDLGDGPAAYRRLEDTLRRNGHGSQAVIITRDADGRAHAWNAVNHNGKITYIDAQTGRRSDQPLHSGDHGVFAVPLGPDRNPVTPDHHADPSHHTDPAHDRRAPAEAAGDSSNTSPPEISAERRAELMREHVRLANEDPDWRAQHYTNHEPPQRLRIKKLVDGVELPHLVRDADGNLISAHDLPSAPGESRFNKKSLDLSSVPDGNLPALHSAAANRRASVELGNAQKAFDKDESPENRKALDEAQEKFDERLPGRDNNSKISEEFGHQAAVLHAIPHRFPDAVPIDLPKTPNGANMFDGVYRRPNGEILIVEEKAPAGDPDWRKGKADPDPADPSDDGGAGGLRVQQGTRPYIRTILREMSLRVDPDRDPNDPSEYDPHLANEIRQALKDGKVQYVLVKVNEDDNGKYTGVVVEDFRI